MYNGEMGEQLKAMDSMHKYVWARVRSIRAYSIIGMCFERISCEIQIVQFFRIMNRT